MRVEHLILDRDGVLNREPASGWVTHAADWAWERNALEGLRRLCAGRRVSVATNQSCVGRGLASVAEIEATHAHAFGLAAAAGARVDAVFVCPHAPEDGCDCRKPAPGLLIQAIAASDVDPSQTLFVGDAATDLEAGRRAGVAVALVRTGKGAATAVNTPDVAVFDDLCDLADFLERGGPQREHTPIAVKRA